MRVDDGQRLHMYNDMWMQQAETTITKSPVEMYGRSRHDYIDRPGDRGNKHNEVNNSSNNESFV